MADDREDGPVVSDAQLQAEVSTRKTEVAALLGRKNKAGALTAALLNPPIHAKSNDIKESNAEIVESVIAAISDSEMAGIVEGLDMESCDNLMKYVFRSMGKANNCAAMLKLHALLTEKAGVGCIVRAMTDRKTV